MELDAASMELDAASMELDAASMELDAASMELDAASMELDAASMELDAAHSKQGTGAAYQQQQRGPFARVAGNSKMYTNPLFVPVSE
jgi:uncharacterized protein (DUF3084 family)